MLYFIQIKNDNYENSKMYGNMGGIVLQIISMPVVEYLKMCKTVARQRGFVWVMVLLARERDVIHSYHDLKHYWDLYNDLTGNKILFIMSIANRSGESYNTYPAHEIKEWRKLYNPNPLIMNQNIPTILGWEFLSEKSLPKYRNDIGSIDGLYKNQTIAKSIDNMSASEIATFIHQKYSMVIKAKTN